MSPTRPKSGRRTIRTPGRRDREPHPRQRHDDRQEQLHQAQVLPRIDDAGEVGVDEAAGQARSPAEPAKPVLPPGERTLHADENAQCCPHHCREVQDDDPAEPAGQEATDREKHEEGEVDQHHCVAEYAVGHTTSMSRERAEAKGR